MSVIVSIALATICFTSNGINQCYPVLFGKNTPVGTYQITQRYVLTPGYGGDVLQFSESATTVLAIHRTWLGNQMQRRPERLLSTNITDRKITGGCINVDPVVYQQLVECCANSQLLIQQ